MENSEVGVDRYFLKLGRKRKGCIAPESFIAFNSFSRALDGYRYSRQSWRSRGPSRLVCNATRWALLPTSPKRTKTHSSARRNPSAWPRLPLGSRSVCACALALPALRGGPARIVRLLSRAILRPEAAISARFPMNPQ